MYTDILNFWFDEIQKSKWFIEDSHFDKLIIEMFSDKHTQAKQCELYEWRKTPDGCLAEIIILDQFSRNIFRGTPSAFVTDPLALSLSQSAISIGVDKKLTSIQRNFLYMPFMHSESIKIHDQAIALYEKNGDKDSLSFEIKHREIIQKFGRYPHRNIVLGRQSTAAELKFLALPGSAF